MTLASGDHLPKRRPDGKPLHPSWLPRHRRGTSPQMIGRYPDYDVLETAHAWDQVTREVVLARLHPPARLRFFTAAEEPTLHAFCDTVLAQDEDPRIPVAEAVDDKLASGDRDGYRYADMPDDGDTWRLVLAALDETARATYGRRLAECDEEQRESVVGQFADGKVSGGTWGELNVERAWSIVMRYCLAGFYPHPWAWNEIGFGGPAYPRGFMRLGPVGVLEPYEKPGAVTVDPVSDTHSEDKDR